MNYNRFLSWWGSSQIPWWIGFKNIHDTEIKSTLIVKFRQEKAKHVKWILIGHEDTKKNTKTDIPTKSWF